MSARAVDAPSEAVRLTGAPKPAAPLVVGGGSPFTSSSHEDTTEPAGEDQGSAAGKASGEALGVFTVAVRKAFPSFIQEAQECGGELNGTEDAEAKFRCRTAI